MRGGIPQSAPGEGVRERRSEFDAAISSVLESGRYVLGPSVAAFERNFAAYLGTARCVGVASGTDAIELALRACGVRAGDTVLTVSHSAVATAAAIVRCGATPLFVDVDERTYTMDPTRLDEAVRSLPAKSAPRAVVPVHLYGSMADMPSIVGIARAAGLAVVEDCAQAHGASLSGAKAGTLGDAAAFSFYPTKNLGGLGDGGAVVTDSDEVADKVRELREYGWRERYISVGEGCNSRLDEMQAAILSVGLSHLDQDNARRQELATIYDVGLADTGVVLPVRPTDSVHVFHQYVVRTSNRPDVIERLLSGKVGTGIHYPVPIHRQQPFMGYVDGRRSLETTERIAEEILSLPMFPQLGTLRAERVVSAMRAAIGQ